MNITTQRLELHERVLRELRAGQYASAAHGIRRLLMLLPPDHEARCDLLRVLAYAERPNSALEPAGNDG